MVKIKALPPLEELTSLFRLDPASPSGLVWIASGVPAGSLGPKGYFRVSIKRKVFACHRIIWSIANGRLIEPSMQIDHINGKRGDNRLCNLRECTNAQNLQNVVVYPGRDGMTGVERGEGSWRALIHVNGKRRRLGSFRTPEAAHAAYLAAKRELHPFSPPTPRTEKHNSTSMQEASDER